MTTGQAADSENGRLDRSGARTLAAAILALQGLRPFQNIFFSNPVPYAQVLEEGSSSQAPAGMVAITLQELRTEFP